MLVCVITLVKISLQATRKAQAAVYKSNGDFIPTTRINRLYLFMLVFIYPCANCKYRL